MKYLVEKHIGDNKKKKKEFSACREQFCLFSLTKSE